MKEIDATQMVEELNPDYLEKVKKSLKERVKSNSPSDLIYKGAEVFDFGNNQNGYVVLYDRETDEVLYFVRYKEVTQNLVKAGRQVLVWRSSAHFASTGFADHVFFLKLLPKFQVLFADQQQTEKGREFWQYAIDKALKIPGLFVYVLDRRQHPNTLSPIKNHADLKKYDAVLWGKDEGHLRTFAVISKRELQLTSKE